MQNSEWKQTALRWWVPAVTYLLASVLNLSQKQSPIAVVILLSICTLWTWIVILALDWWTTASGWKRIVRAVVPLPALVPLLWGAIVFFRPEMPPKSYPWLSTTHVLTDRNSVTAVQLYVHVRDEPPSPDASKGIATLSALHNLDVDVSMPVAVSGQGWHSCGVGHLTVSEFNNNVSNQHRIASLPLTADTTLLEVRASSQNATWYGAVAIHRKGDHLDWEEFLGGWVQTNQNKDAVVVGEIRKGMKSTPTKKEPFLLTREYLIAAGVPEMDGSNAAKQPCPAMF